MTMRYRGALECGGEYLALPPYGLQIAASEIIEAEYARIPHAIDGAVGQALLNNRRIGWTLSVSGLYLLPSVFEGLYWQQLLDEFLVDSGGRARTVTLFRWTDDIGTIKDAWRGCTKEGSIEWDTEVGTERMRGFRFGLRSIYPGKYATAPDGSTPPASIYENLISGGVPSSGTGVITAMADTMKIPVKFGGVIDAVTGAGNVVYRQKALKLHATKAMRITGIQIVGCDGLDSGASSGSTTVAASLGDYNDGLSVLAASAAYNASSGALATGAIDVPANTTVYVFVSAAAGHQGIEAILHVEAV